METGGLLEGSAVSFFIARFAILPFPKYPFFFSLSVSIFFTSEKNQTFFARFLS
jgi:hypothetical protein